MLALGLGIAAIQLLPTAELALISVRAGGLAYDFAMVYSLYPWQLMSLLAPDFFGNPAAGDYWGPGSYWEASGYIGVLPLLAAGVGLVVPAARPGLPRLFFFGIAVVSLLFSLGHYLPVYPLVFAYVPGFDLFQAPARFLFWYTLAAAILAGIGGDAVLARAGSPGMVRLGRGVLAAGLSISLAIAALVVLLGPTGGVRPTFISALGKLGVLLAMAGLLLSLGGRLPRGWWQLGLGVFVAADLLVFGLPLNPTTRSAVYEGGGMAAAGLPRGGEELYRVYTPGAAFLGKFFATHSFRTFGSSEPSAIERIRHMAVPNVAMAAGLQESYNYDPLQVGVAQEFLEAVDSSNLDARLLGLMNVRYVLSDTLPSPNRLKLAQWGASPAYENPLLLDRAFVVDRAVQVSSTQEALRELQKPEFDPRRTVIVTGPEQSGGFSSLLEWLDRLSPVSASQLSARSDKAGATLVEYAPQRVAVATAVDRASYLVLGDTYYPGWRAWVNGTPAPIHRANGAFRAVEVPAGQSLVEFRYEPASFKVGATVSALSVAVAGAMFIRAGRRRREN